MFCIKATFVEIFVWVVLKKLWKSLCFDLNSSHAAFLERKAVPETLYIIKIC